MKSQEPDKRNDIGEKKKLVNSYLQYSTLGFQMIAIIGVFAFIGYSIDEKKNSSTPLYTAFLSLAGVFIALYLVIRSLKKIKP
jgi:F0F1-type ATP synthase assembly protein I